MTTYKLSAPEGYTKTNDIMFIADSRFRGEKVLCQRYLSEGERVHDGSGTLWVRRDCWVAVGCANGTVASKGEGE